MSLGIFAGGALGGVVASTWGASGIFVFSAALMLVWLLVAVFAAVLAARASDLAAAAVERGDCDKIRRVFLSARTGEGLDLLRDALAEVAQQTFGDNADRLAGTADERPEQT